MKYKLLDYDFSEKWLLRGFVVLWFSFNMAVMIWAGWNHKLPTLILTAIFAVPCAILMGRIFWPEVKIETVTVTRHPAIDKDSTAYKMGYEDGRGDQDEANQEAMVPSTHRRALPTRSSGWGSNTYG